MNNSLQATVEKVAEPGDFVAYSVVLGAFVGFLPHVATILSIVWIALRIWESDTVRSVTRRQKAEGDE